ncbi:hypothetical protein Tco_0505787 [Tanacetum coccineum]
MHQLDTFYNSLSYNDQDSLNSAAGGNFLYKSPNEGLQIIENKAKVRCSRNAVMRVSTNAPPSSNSSSNFEFQQMAAALEDKMTLTFRNEMNEMKNMMKAFVPTPVPIKAVEERCTTCGNNHSFNMCPMTRGGYEAPVYHDNFQQFQQTASVGNFVQNGNSGYRPSNLANHTHPPGFPSEPQGKPSIQGISLIKWKPEVTRLKVLPSTKNIQPPVIQKSHDPVKPVSSPISPELSSAQVDNSSPSKTPFKGQTPYPSRVEREKKDSNDKVQIQNFGKYPRVPLILGRPFLRTARVLIDVHGEELVIRDGLERIVFKPDGSQDNESIHMMDAYDDRVKDVCEPESNDDSTTSAIVDDFESLLWTLLQMEELREISDPVAREGIVLPNLD